MHVLVTGASGMLGTAVAAELATRGHHVHALVRDPGKLRTLLPELYPQLTVHRGDITDLSIWDRVLPGIEGVVHTAAYFREYYEPGNDAARLHQTNVTAVSELLAAAERHGVSVVVHTSSTTVIAPGTPKRPADEHSPVSGDRSNLYRASKIDAEQTVLDYVAAGGTVRVPMILPSWMWGPRDIGPTAAGRLYNAITQRRLPAIPRAGTHVVDARDVAAGAAAALEQGVTGRRYILAGTWTPLPTIAHLIAHAEQTTMPRVIPPALATSLATMIETSARLRRRTPTTTRRAVRTLIDGNRSRIDSTTTTTALGIEFRPIEQTIPVCQGEVRQPVCPVV